MLHLLAAWVPRWRPRRARGALIRPDVCGSSQEVARLTALRGPRRDPRAPDHPVGGAFAATAKA
eukprot:3393104-Alexandrium_andersonii.AAC.1